MSSGMASLIDSQNSAIIVITSTMSGSEKLNTLPCPESFDNASAPALRTFNSGSERKATIFGMACVIDSRNSTTNTSTTVQVRSDL